MKRIVLCQPHFFTAKIMLCLPLMFVVIALINGNLIESIFEQLLPKKKYHLGMTFRRMFERSCQHLGMSFESDIDGLDWVHIPRKTAEGGSKNETGFPSNSEPIYVFGDFIRTMKEMFNADYRIKNNTFIFDPRLARLQNNLRQNKMKKKTKTILINKLVLGVISKEGIK